MTEPRLRGLRSADPARLERLADRICASLGEAPRPLPSRMRIAAERASAGVGLAASILAAITVAISLVANDGTHDESSSIVASALKGSLPRADDVYVAMRRSPAPEERR